MARFRRMRRRRGSYSYSRGMRRRSRNYRSYRISRGGIRL